MKNEAASLSRSTGNEEELDPLERLGGREAERTFDTSGEALRELS